MEHKQINKLHKKIRFIGKNLYEQYLDDFINIGINLPSCVVKEVWLYTNLSLPSYHFKRLTCGGGGKGSYYLKLLLEVVWLI